MITKEETKDAIESINELIRRGVGEEKSDEYWRNVGAKLLTLIDKIVENSVIVNSLIPKVYSKQNPSLLEQIFLVLDKLKTANDIFECESWNGKLDSGAKEQDIDKLSFYELAYSRFCSFTSQLLGDKFATVHKLLIKNIFGQSYICSYFASDIYMFMMRIIHPHRRMGMAQVIMNICRLAPPEAFVKGAALINRIKHPIVNFEHANYQYLLELS